MKVLLYVFFILSILFLGTALGLTISPLQGHDSYFASGKIIMDKQEFTDFTNYLFLNDYEIDGTKIKATHTEYASDNMLVKIDNLRVDKDFPYGELSTEFDKYGTATYGIENILSILGGVLLFAVFFIKITEE